MRFYTSEKIGPKREVTPEGFLLCRDVPVARTGVQIYGPNELPLTPGRDGLIRVARDEDEVFRPETMASLVGKSLVNDHPSSDVTPKNWKALTMGVLLNPRRGEGPDDDLFLVDLLVTDEEGISLINDGKRELSCGYDAEYEELRPGEARQYNIVINHVALVRNGRCGERCSIGDQAMCECSTCKEKVTMAKKVTTGKTTWDAIQSRIRRAFKDNDPDAMEAALKEGATDEEATGQEEGGASHVHIHLPGGPGSVKQGEAEDAAEEAAPAGEAKKDEEEAPGWFKTHSEASDKRFGDLETGMNAMKEAFGKMGSTAAATDAVATDAAGEEQKKIEGALKEEAPPGTGDKAAAAKDSAYLADSFQETAAIAEILIPGVSLPTFDRAASPVKTYDSICNVRRKTLDLAYASPHMRPMVEEILGGGKKLDTASMTCDALRHVFRSVGALKRLANNAGGTRDAEFRPQGTRVASTTPKNGADLNKFYEKHYADKRRIASGGAR